MKTAAIYTIINPKQPDSHLSGGFAAIDSVIEAIEKSGYQTKIITPNEHWEDPSAFDACLYADIFNDPQGSKWFDNHQYESFTKVKNYMVLECAYTGCTPTPYGIGGRLDTAAYEPNKLSEFIGGLMSLSKLNIFLSPLHRMEFTRFLRQYPVNAYDFFQPINTSIFNNTRSERDIPYLFVGALNWFKGLDDVLEIFGDKGLSVVGRKTNIVSAFPSSINYLGELTPTELAKVYNRTKRFIHIPRWQEPSGRTVVEAALCGCELIVNENVGALSFGYDIRDQELSKLSADHLANTIAKVLEK